MLHMHRLCASRHKAVLIFKVIVSGQANDCDTDANDGGAGRAGLSVISVLQIAAEKGGEKVRGEERERGKREQSKKAVLHCPYDRVYRARSMGERHVVSKLSTSRRER